MHILFITDCLPYPLISGDRIRVYNLIKRIAEKHQVSLVSFLQTPQDALGVPHMQKICQNVETAPLPRSTPIKHLPGLLRYAMAGIPLEHKFLYSEEFETKIRTLFASTKIDAVQIEHSRMANYIETIPKDIPVLSLLTFHNVIAHQYKSIFRIEPTTGKRFRSWLYSLMMKRWEPRFAEHFNRCLTVSEADRELLLRANPRLHVDVVPNGVDTQQYQPLSSKGLGPTLLFIGNMRYAPCADGAIWFCEEILPRIRQSIEGVQVWIVGVSPPAEVARLNGNGIHVTGQVEDVVPYYKKSAVCVVPLRAGGGTRLKILEAMALGRPVITTRIGCEGLEVADGQHLLIGDNPDRFAEQTIRVLRDSTIYLQLRDRARHLVETHYSWDSIAEKQIQIYKQLSSIPQFNTV